MEVLHTQLDSEYDKFEFNKELTNRNNQNQTMRGSLKIGDFKSLK